VPVYVERENTEFQEATTEQDVVATVEPVVNNNGEIIGITVDGEV